jgi:protein O-GlcNAc transferase
MDRAVAIRAAADHLAAGRVAEAEQVGLAALADTPDDPEVLDLLGQAAARLGRADEAVERHLAAARLRPDLVEVLQEKARDLRRAGQFAPAIALGRRAEELHPDRPQVSFALGNAWRDWGRPDRAVECYMRALRLAPGYVAALTNLGDVFWRLGRRAEAMAALRSARDHAPDSPEARLNLGQLAAEGADWAEAETCFREAARLRPAAESCFRLGFALARQGCIPEAVAAYRNALAVQPDFAPALDHVARVLTRASRSDEAEEYVRRALRVTPDSAETLLNLGNLRSAQRAHDEAAGAYRRVLAIDPDRLEALVNLGDVLGALGRDDEATDCFRRAAATAADAVEPRYNLGNSHLAQGRAPEALTHYRAAHALAPDNPRVHSDLLYCLYFCPGVSAAEIGREHRAWDIRHAAPLAPATSPAVDRKSGGRLRVGYLSPDFREHPVARFLLPALEHRDRAEFEVFAYASASAPDAVTARCRSAVDVWRDVSGWPDDRVAGLVRADRIDLLVDLSMHLADHRLGVFARKPAPVQVTHLAYCGTTGLTAIDYRITDPHLDPPGGDPSVYAEQSAWLPATYWCYQPLLDVPTAPVPPSVTNCRVTFGCLNNFAKASDPALRAWANILRAVPGSRLVLYCPTGAGRRRVVEFMTGRQVGADRLTFLGPRPAAEYFAAYTEIDVALDPFPYAGGTTTCDALWMGVPVVSLAGETAVGRGGVSILTNMGLPELIAWDVAEYVRLAADLARDAARLRELRRTLRDRMRASPLMDARRYARDLEGLFAAMWTGRVPAPSRP